MAASRHLALALLFGGIAAATAEEVDIERGAHLAEIHCAECHGAGEAAPLSRFARTMAAPEAFEDRILFGHVDLPQFQFTANELADLVAYIGTLGR